MNKVILDHIDIKQINIEYFDLHMCFQYNVYLDISDKNKIIYKGYVGKNETLCFFTFTIIMIIDCHYEELFIFKYTYPFLLDIIISIILILLDFV